MTTPEVRAGQRWEDKDRREQGCVVTVTDVLAGYVHYNRRGRKRCSYLERFTKAFRLVSDV